MNLTFDEDSVEWLKEKGFSEKDISDSERLIGTTLKGAEKGETTIKLPAGVSHNVAALVYSIFSTMGEGAVQERFISISDEAREAFEEELELEELESTVGKVGKIKLGSRYSGARRKSSVKKERFHPE